jgi:carbon monoxide dehydrogenase subunit G
MTSTFEISGHIDNTPEDVIAYVADPRNRPLFFPSLKSISDVQGEPTAVGTTWKWTFVALGMQFSGRGRCLKHEPGKLYSFQTDGGIQSTFTYRAEPESGGTKLTVNLEYQVPESAKPKLPTGDRAQKMREEEAHHVLQNLQLILNR